MPSSLAPATPLAEWTGEIDGLTFRVLSTRHAAADAPTFVLVHGIGTSHRYLTRLHAELAARATVHSIDLPGFGGLPAPKGAPGVPEISHALGTLLERTGVTHAVLLGHSMGVQWVVDLAAQRPDLARAVVLCSPVVDRAHRTRRMQAFLLSHDSALETPRAALTVFREYLRSGLRWYAAQARHMVRYPLEDRVATLSVPVLIVRGSKDRIAGQRWCSELRDRAADGTLAVVPGHRHLVQFTAPATVAAGIRRFLGS